MHRKDGAKTLAVTGWSSNTANTENIENSNENSTEKAHNNSTQTPDFLIERIENLEREQTLCRLEK